MTGNYLFALGVVALVMGSAFALVRLAQARGLPLARERALRVVAQQSLGMGASLVLVEVEGARVLVGVSKAGVHEIQPIRHAELVSASMPQPAPSANDRIDNVTSFSAVLKRAGSWR